MLPVGPPGYGDSPYSAAVGVRRQPRCWSTSSGWSTTACCRAAERANGRATSSCALRSRPSERRRRRIRDLDALPRRGARLARGLRALRALKRAHGGVQWTRWPTPAARSRPGGARASARASYARRDRASRASCSGASTRSGARCAPTPTSAASALIGDMPIFVAHDSADVWQHRELFQLDDDGRADASSPACRPTTSARPASAGATRSTAGTRCATTGYALVDRALPRRRSRASTPSASITSSASSRYWEIPGRRADRRERALGAGPGRRASSTRSRARSARCRSSPRISAWSRPRSRALRDRFGLPGHQHPPVRVRHRPAGARLPAAQLPAHAPSSTPARTTTTPPSAGSTIRAAAGSTRSPEQTEQRARGARSRTSGATRRAARSTGR